MSGGSWNYLCYADLTNRTYDVEKMAEELRYLGFEKAADETLRIHKAMVLAEDLRIGLQEVWRAVEWRDSSDIGEAERNAIVSKWEEAQ